MTGVLAGVSDIAARGFQWWSSELASLVPGRRAAADATSQADIIVNLDARGAIALVAPVKRGRTAVAEYKVTSEADALEILSRLARSRPDANVCVRLPHSACFERRVEIPEKARRQAGSILTLDFERATPFKLSDVYVSHTLTPSPMRKGWLAASQYVVKRKLTEAAIANIEAVGLKASSMDCWSADGETPVPMNFLWSSAPDDAVRTSLRPMLLMTILALALACSAAWMGVSRREAALQSLEDQVAAARGKADAARNAQAALDAVQSNVNAVRALKSSQPAAVEILNELTRLLADDVVLNDLKLDADAIDFSGLAKSSAAVVPVLERSAMFKDVLLTSPVTFDANTGKERFSMRLHLRRSSRTASAAAQDVVPQ
jgi:general secretion pathway protein L